jgi:hypothetical protein
MSKGCFAILALYMRRSAKSPGAHEFALLVRNGAYGIGDHVLEYVHILSSTNKTNRTGR